MLHEPMDQSHADERAFLVASQVQSVLRVTAP